ncbi:hypothetical protein D3C85_1164000 [compost metagenome]
MAASRHHIDKGLVGVALLEQRLQVDTLVRHSGVEGRVDAADHRSQMRHESQADRAASGAAQALGDFRQVAVALHRVGHHAFTRFTEQRANLGAATSTADAGLAVGDQLAGIGQASLQQRDEAELGSGGIATRHGDQACALDGLAVHFRQTVDSFRQQRGGAMGLAVPLGPFLGVL